jgi:hypothetical protein
MTADQIDLEELSDIERRVLGRVTIVRSTGYTPMPTPIMDADPVGPTPGAHQGDDYPLTYDADGHVEIPACLDSPQAQD